MEKSSTGLDENVAGLLCYVLGWVSGLVFILLELESKFVRYHAMQSLLVFGFYTIVSIIIIAFTSWIPILGFIVKLLLWLGGIGWALFLIIRAYQGAKPKVLWAGDFAERWAQKKGG